MPDVDPAAEIETRSDLARVLRRLRRREARSRHGPELTYRELAAKTGWSRAVIGEYFTGHALPPTDRFDALIQLLGATPAEQGALATARDRVEEAGRSPGTAGPPPVPRQLPARPPHFVGRQQEYAELDRCASAAEHDSAVVVPVLSGPGGVGKTALAVHWAHHVAGRFPDGQLYVDLRGYHPGEPVSAADALGGFLRSLGVDGAALPSDLAERAARYRTLLADRRILVVLDNAATADQVRPLLPGSPSCLALVTSRDRLAGLVARDGARRIELDVLVPGEATLLLRGLIGPRVDAEPGAATALAEGCGRLPLALRVAAEQAASRPDDSLADLVEWLGDEQRRLDALDVAGDPTSGVRAVFSWSYRLLPAECARAFRSWGLHPGSDLDAHVLAALCDVDPETARELLETLCAAHLVQRTDRLRYRMHDLLRAYAAERAAADTSAEAAQASRTRLFDYYRAAALAAMATLFPHHRHGRTSRPPDPPVPPLGQARAALTWLERERSNLVAVCAYAADHGWPQHSVDLAQILAPYLDNQPYPDAWTVHSHAVRAAGTGPDRAGVLTDLGRVCWRLGRPAEALAHLHEAVGIHESSAPEQRGGRSGEIVTRTVLSCVYFGLGRYQESLEQSQVGLAIARAAGDRAAEAKQLINAGEALCQLGDHPGAVAHLQRAIEIAVEVGLPRLRAHAASGLAAAYEGMGRFTEALGHLDQALAFHREFAERRQEAAVLQAKGSVLRRLGHHRQALVQLEQAIRTSEGIGDDQVRAAALNTLGETLCATGRPGEARSCHEQALALAERTSDRRERARARDGLGDACQGTGDTRTALGHWRQAYADYLELRAPAADQVREKIAAASEPAGARAAHAPPARGVDAGAPGVDASS